MSNICRCGRPADDRHCKDCGRSTYVHLSESSIRTARYGKNVAAFRCTKCGYMSDELEVCRAPVRFNKDTVPAHQKVGESHYDMGLRLKKEGKSPSEIVAALLDAGATVVKEEDDINASTAKQNRGDLPEGWTVDPKTGQIDAPLTFDEIFERSRKAREKADKEGS